MQMCMASDVLCSMPMSGRLRSYVDECYNAAKITCVIPPCLFRVNTRVDEEPRLITSPRSLIFGEMLRIIGPRVYLWVNHQVC